MAQSYSKYICLIMLPLIFAFSVNAQISPKKSDKLTAEIKDFRRKLVEAIEKRDRISLENSFADDFTHTHAVGKVDGKAERINSILSGGTTLESAAPDEINIRFYSEKTAVAVGQSKIEKTMYRWTIIYAKIKSRWRLAASQATKIQ